MCLAFLRSGGRRGHMIAYRSACSINRRLWASPRFMERHQTLYNIIDQCIQQPTSKWTWMVGTLAEYKEATQRANATRKIFALVAPGEKSGDKAASHCAKQLLFVPSLVASTLSFLCVVVRCCLCCCRCRR